ncbi:MAG: phosphate starvation-inducible protein PsiF [Ramlibacter sp.]|nr:phosphate starvation-inducible protein PsiF [Ramlibacter sp.]
MKKMLSLMALGLCLSMGVAHAADEKKPTAQQNKMTMCNKDAGDKKGDERKAFMKECLSAKPAAPVTQQDKMKACNADEKAKTLKGDERKKFMSECLSKKA